MAKCNQLTSLPFKGLQHVDGSIAGWVLRAPTITIVWYWVICATLCDVMIDARTSSCQRFKHNTSFMSRLSTRRKDPTTTSSTTVMLPMTATAGSVSPFPSPQHPRPTSPQSPNPLSPLSSSSTRLRSANVLLSPYDLSESCDGRIQSSATDADLQR